MGKLCSCSKKNPTKETKEIKPEDSFTKYDISKENIVA